MKRAFGRSVSAALRPIQIVTLSFLTLILAGGILLALPAASQDARSIGLLDALFTSVSTVCVTGLSVVNTHAQWTVFGKIVILLLIQTGGLGLMTFITLFWIAMGRHISLKERMILSTGFQQETTQGMVRLVLRVIRGTFIAEGIGAIFLTFAFVRTNPPAKALFLGIFHSVSAFCNAGIDILENESLTSYSGDWLVNLIIMALIIMGGLGFTVWFDIGKALKTERGLRAIFRKCSLHSKLALSCTCILFLAGALFFFCMEYTNPHTLGSLPFHQKLLGSVFQSVNLRTAGFYTLDYTMLRDQSKLMAMIFMFIGGSPVSTAGGVKTVSFAVLLIAVASIVRGDNTIRAFHRSISLSVLQRALAVNLLGLSVTLIGAILMTTFGNTTAGLLENFFETMAAFSTTGLSLQVTPGTSLAGRILLMIIMFIGRIGPISVAMSLTLRQNSGVDAFYPEEKLIIG